MNKKIHLNERLLKEVELLRGERSVLKKRIDCLKSDRKTLHEQNKKLRKKMLKLKNDVIMFNDTPRIKNLNNLCDYWFLNVNDLLELKWKPPYFQRPVDEERVQDIVEHYQLKLKDNVFEFISPLIVAKYEDMLYIIDGQHRLKAIEYLFGHDEKFNEDKKIPLVVIPANSMEHIEELFQTLNKLLPLSDVYKLEDKNKKKIIVDASAHFFRKYRKIFTAKKARRPFINKNDFENYLLNNDVIEDLDIIDSSNDLIFALEKLNTFYKNQPYDYFPKKGQANFGSIVKKIESKGGLYFGLFPKFEWINDLRKRVWQQEDTTMGKGLRDQVWNTYIGIKHGIYPCLCCDIEQISQQNFEMGHIISQKNGGSNNICNLRPICSKCNKSMGIKAMFDYMDQNGLNIIYSKKMKKIYNSNSKKEFYKNAAYDT